MDELYTTTKPIETHMEISDLIEPKNIESEYDFYKYIVDISKYTNCENVLKRDSQIIYDIIMKDYRKNIQLSALRGDRKAYICIYESKTKLNDTIPIDNFIRMTDLMKEKFAEFKIESIMEKIKKKLHPFNVDIITDESATIVNIIITW